MRTEIDAVGVERYSSEVEAAVYFCILEAIQNVVKYADANQARVTLTGDAALSLHASIARSTTLT